MKHVVCIALRVVVLAAAAAAVITLADLGMSEAEAGANIGAGLLAFATIMAITLVWSFVDGRRAPRTGISAAAGERDAAGAPAPRQASLTARVLWWAVVAVLLAALAPLQAQGFTPPFDATVLASDAVNLAPFHLGLVGIPAALGLALGALTRRRPRA